MHDFDIILAMDWLSSDHAFIKCREKKMVFKICGQTEFCFGGGRERKPLCMIPALQADRMLRGGCFGRDLSKKRVSLEKIPIM